MYFFVNNPSILPSIGSIEKNKTRACLDQVLIAIRSFTVLCDHNRSKTRLIAIMNLIAKLGIIYAMPASAQPRWTV